LIDTVNTLHSRKIGFRSLQENLDTTSPGGKLFFHIIGALAEFERDLIRERTNAGLMAARARRRVGGRPRLLDGKKVQMAKALLADRRNNIKEVCSTLGVSRSTLYRYASN
jgi:DNA invertase Pin-like site-specific DNA recombinase